MAESLIGSPEISEHSQREIVYLSAVAKYKLGKHIDAKRQVAELLKVSILVPSLRMSFVASSQVCRPARR